MYLSEDETCRDLLTRESTLTLHLLPRKQFSVNFDKMIGLLCLETHEEANVILPDWTQGTWLSIDGNTFSINHTGMSVKIEDQPRFLRLIHSKYSHEYSIRLRAKSLEQW